MLINGLSNLTVEFWQKKTMKQSRHRGGKKIAVVAVLMLVVGAAAGAVVTWLVTNSQPGGNTVSSTGSGVDVPAQSTVALSEPVNPFSSGVSGGGTTYGMYPIRYAATDASMRLHVCLCTKRIFNLQPLPYSQPSRFLKTSSYFPQRATCSSRASTATSLSFPASMLARSPSTPLTAFSSRLARRASTDPTTFLSWSPGKFLLRIIRGAGFRWPTL